jgi:glycosyltransferase involved in cell wall biosynthesis
MASLTIVMGVRNRAGDRLERCLSSLEAQTFQDFYVILVDYGSNPAQANAARQIAERFSFCRYIYSETRGYPWNRARALNIGGRMADTPYLMTTDVDMLFPKQFLQIALERANERKVLHCRPTFLPRHFHDWENFERFPGPAVQGHAFLGGCQIVSTSVFQSVRGFDEYFEYWGVEDRDLNQRLARLGIETEWINDWTAIYHQWHPPMNYNVIGAIPDGLWNMLNVYYYLMGDQVVRNSPDWGHIHTLKERIVFAFLDFESNHLIKSNEVHTLNSIPDTYFSINKMLENFFALPAGHALAVTGADYPSRSLVAERLFRLANILLDRAHIGFHIGYTRNFLHSFIANFIKQQPAFIADYYLNFPAESGITVLVRGA